MKILKNQRKERKTNYYICYKMMKVYSQMKNKIYYFLKKRGFKNDELIEGE